MAPASARAMALASQLPHTSALVLTPHCLELASIVTHVALDPAGIVLLLPNRAVDSGTVAQNSSHSGVRRRCASTVGLSGSYPTLTSSRTWNKDISRDEVRRHRCPRYS
ncbi:hypothetical protein NDU88_009948 [Pleurodeles waltl]|uniref:Uncharacterized protein n=1 Tax=Pleurodeles waltl TaxID=8319 RepID=A0AAV7QYW6_PLEWA|nr:hypothetical protein NDU88_009948 [Pleurodeles waltl]